MSQCPNSRIGCKFVGPRATVHNHLQCECAYRNDPHAYQYVNPHADYQSNNELALASAGTSAAQLRMQAEQQALAHGAFTMMHSSSAAAISALDPSLQQQAFAHSTLVNTDPCRVAQLPFAQTTAAYQTTTTSSLIGMQRGCADDYRQHTTMQTSSTAKYVIGGLRFPALTQAPRPPALTSTMYESHRHPVMEGEPCLLELSRGCFDLGISIVGGVDTPLSCIIIQEIYVDGVVARDGRLRAGDQVSYSQPSFLFNIENSRISRLVFCENFASL